MYVHNIIAIRSYIVQNILHIYYVTHNDLLYSTKYLRDKTFAVSNLVYICRKTFTVTWWSANFHSFVNSVVAKVLHHVIMDQKSWENSHSLLKIHRNCASFVPYTFLNQARAAEGRARLVSWNRFVRERWCMCVCVCPPPRPLITSHVKGMRNKRRVRQFYGPSVSLYHSCRR